MLTQINESVSVDLLSNALTGKVYPWVISWRGRRYTITKVGLHHRVRDGRDLIHIFSVTDGTTFFRLEFNTDTLGWKLIEIDG
jgi:hypothetical protein